MEDNFRTIALFMRRRVLGGIHRATTFLKASKLHVLNSSIPKINDKLMGACHLDVVRRYRTVTTFRVVEFPRVATLCALWTPRIIQLQGSWIWGLCCTHLVHDLRDKARIILEVSRSSFLQVLNCSQTPRILLTTPNHAINSPAHKYNIRNN